MLAPRIAMAAVIAALFMHLLRPVPVWNDCGMWFSGISIFFMSLWATEKEN